MDTSTAKKHSDQFDEVVDSSTDRVLKLLVVDDSKILRDSVSNIFANDERVNVVAAATNGREALDAIAKYKPDVITLDIRMPEMDGVTALKHIMIRYPTPVVMLSSLTMEGAAVTFDALRYGAVDFIAKPSAVNGEDVSAQEDEIRNKVKFASVVEVEAIKYIRNLPNPDLMGHEADNDICTKAVAIGSAEGGYGALLKIIPNLRADSPVAYLSTLYAGPEYVDAFATYLNNYSAVEVKRAEHDEVLRPGVCYLNSGNYYMTVEKQDDGSNRLHVQPAPFASRKGAVDMLMFSLAEAMGENAAGLVLSGTGTDGAEGLEEIHRVGGTAFVQDLKTCLYKGMVTAAMDWCPNAEPIGDSRLADALNELG